MNKNKHLDPTKVHMPADYYLYLTNLNNISQLWNVQVALPLLEATTPDATDASALSRYLQQMRCRFC